MNIILEGLDATGKSTLANKLSEKYNLDIEKLLTGDYYHFSDFTDKIYDRHFISEYVFSIIYNRPIKLSIADYINLMKEMAENDSIIVIFTSSNLDILYNRVKERLEENYITELPSQQYWFNQAIKFFCLDKYKDCYICDIAKPDAYEKLDKWLEQKIC